MLSGVIYQKLHLLLILSKILELLFGHLSPGFILSLPKDAFVVQTIQS
ncbi:MAG: hypothetical protein JWP88_469 [Flaviaesturariibacter sp.]|nr:hypothetical protein [Flaviaesturariibacter sp.]